MDGSLDIVVVGAGIGGLASALVFARAGHCVTLVERDDTPMPADIEGAFDWNRRGAPQVRHPHAFLGLARTILRDRLPDVLQALLNHGVHEVSMADSTLLGDLSDRTRERLHRDNDILLLGCRRTTFEWVLRRLVLAEANVTLQVGVGVTGLAVAPTKPAPTVVGVRLDDGTDIAADLVIAGTGRRSDLPAWLGEPGVLVEETVHDPGVVYFSRFYRSEEFSDFGFRAAIGAGLTCGVIGADAGTYSITAVIDADDRELRTHLNDSDRFDATMRLMPELADVTAMAGTPIHPVHLMTGLINRLRRYTNDAGDPLAIGVLAVGDAHTCTNPAYGRGQSLALLQAVLAADAVSTESDLAAAARRYEASSKAQVEPWYHASVMTDQLQQRRPGNGLSSTATGARGRPDLFTLMIGARDEPELLHALLRVVNLLEPPESLFRHAEAMQRAIAAGQIVVAGDHLARRQPSRVSRDQILSVA
jgi:flavin-dependent dehydrogenase